MSADGANTRRRIRAEFVGSVVSSSTKGAEVGVWKGDFSSLLLNDLNLQKLTMIDPWRFSTKFPSSWYGGKFAKNQEDMDTIHEYVRQRFSKEIATGRVKLIRKQLDALDYLDSDWVYVDGDHTVEGVSADIRELSRLMETGSVVIFDDYGEVGWWNNGVTNAVTSAIESGLLREIAQAENQIACELLSSTKR